MENSKTLTLLPILHKLSPLYIVSLIVAVLMSAASIAGLLNPDMLYPTVDAKQNFLPNDLVNLLIGLPILLGSLWFVWRGSLLALLLWPGSLFYNFYNYLVYAFGLPFNWMTGVYLALALLSAFGAFDLLRRIDQKTIQVRLTNVAPVKTVGWVMIVFGVLFIFRAISVVAGPITSGSSLPIAEIGLVVADITLSILWIASGGLLLRQKPWGFVSSLGLLFAASMLFVGLIVFLFVQPLFAEVALSLVDIVVVAVMSLVCFVPFGMFVRAVRSQGARSIAGFNNFTQS